MSEPTKAVFLSYASQDAEAAKRIADALRAGGVEVWFDQSELIGGDQWDQKIRGQVKACALFVPIISAATQARLEGYFRLEWKIAAQRTHTMADERVFLLPVVIDETRDADARVPAEFKSVQWTRLPGGEAPEKFCARVQKLLSGEAADVGRGLPPPPSATAPASPAGSGDPALQRKDTWLVPVIIAVIAAGGVALWRPWRSAPPPVAPTGHVAVASVIATELARVRSRIIPVNWQKADFESASSILDRLIQANPEESGAWALRSIINSLQVTRNYETGTKALEVGKTAAERALRLAPADPLAELALGLHLVAMVTRGGDIGAARPHIDRGVAGLPADQLTRYAELISYWINFQVKDAERTAKAWLVAEPGAAYPTWILGQMYLISRQFDEAEQWAELAATDNEVTGARALVTLFDARFYLRADLPAARAAVDRRLGAAASVHRLVYARWLVAMAERRWDQALQELQRIPEKMLFDRNFHGPKPLLAGLAHEAAGRLEVALNQFRESEKLLLDELAHDPENGELHAVLALTLACAGRAPEARRELNAVVPLMEGAVPNIYTGQIVALIAQTYNLLGDRGRMAVWLRKLLAGPSSLPLTPASIKIDPRFNSAIDAPEIQALLKEFAHLDVPTAAIAPAKTDQKSVAVLAFANLSDDKANEYFSDGISEELLNVLAKVPGLKVSARTSAFHFKGKDTPIPEIARQLGVAYVVEGSVRKQGDKVRITAQLIKAADGFHVWSDTFTRDLKDIFAVQDEIAGLIAQQLQLKLGTTDRAKRAVNPEAHQLVLEGRHYLTLRTAEDFDQAERAFTAALKIDPQFAQAQAGLANTTALRGRYLILDGVGRVEEFDQLAIAQSRLALQMDPTLAEPHAAMGFVFTGRRQLAEAEQEFQQAFAANPNYATAYHWHSHVFGVQGRLDLALKEISRATTLDPLSFIITYIHGFYTCDTQQYAETLVILDRAASLRGDTFLPLEADRARMLYELGRKAEALAVARKVLGDPRLITAGWYAAGEALHVLQRGGEIAEANRRAESLIPAMPSGSYQRGYALCALGNFREGLPQLATMPVFPQNRIYFHPMFDPVRDTPEFQQLLVKLNCVEEYKVARATLTRMQREQAAK